MKYLEVMNGKLLLVTIKLPPKTTGSIYVFYIITAFRVRFEFADIVIGIKNNPVTTASKVLDKLHEMVRNCLFSNQTMQSTQIIRRQEFLIHKIV